MAIKTKAELKAYFVNGATPTQSNYEDVIDSFVLQKNDQFSTGVSNLYLTGYANNSLIPTPATAELNLAYVSGTNTGLYSKNASGDLYRYEQYPVLSVTIPNSELGASGDVPIGTFFGTNAATLIFCNIYASCSGSSTYTVTVKEDNTTSLTSSLSGTFSSGLNQDINNGFTTTSLNSGSILTYSYTLGTSANVDYLKVDVIGFRTF